MSRCDTRVPIEVENENFLSQKIFQLFFKTGFLRVLGLWDYFKGKKIFGLSYQSSSGIAMTFQRQKLLFTCNQRRRTLPVRITWKGDWPPVSDCDVGVPVGVKNFPSQKIFHDIVGHGIPGAQCTGAGGQWGRTP